MVVSGVASSAGSADVAKQVQGLAEDLLATARTNRDLLIGLIRTEVERTVNRMGLVGADELNAMARVVERLQSQLDAAIAFGGRATTTKRSGGTAPADGGSAAGRPVRRAPVTFAPAPRSRAVQGGCQEDHGQEVGDEEDRDEEGCDQEVGQQERDQEDGQEGPGEEDRDADGSCTRRRIGTECSSASHGAAHEHRRARDRRRGHS